MSKNESLLSALWVLLREKRGDSIVEMAERLSEYFGELIKPSRVDYIIQELRVNKNGKYDWTIPHVHRGRVCGKTEGRYMAILVDRKAGEYVFDDDMKARKHFKKGSHGTVSHAHSIINNQLTMLEIAMKHSRSSNFRTELLEVIEDLQYSNKKLGRIEEKMRAAA